MDIIDILQEDYRRFPLNPAYEIYASDVYFKDPLTEFRGLDRYKTMIGFIQTWFKQVKIDLHEIKQQGNMIYTEWTMTWITPLPWQPRISIPGRSELTLDENHLIISHIDYWHCSRWDVVQQHFAFSGKN